MSDKIPLVSIYIATKNRLSLLKRAISSVLSQTYPSIELIVSDDGSIDGTKNYMQELSKEYDNVIYIRSDVSQGACVARNKAILRSKGEYVTGLDDDDMFRENRIEAFVKASNKNASFLCSLYSYYNGKNYSHSHYYQPIITRSQIFRRNVVGNQIFVKRKLLIDNKIFYDPSFPAWQDYDFFTNLIFHLGPAKRVYNRSYIVFSNHSKERITNSNRIKRGYRLYSKKYGVYMSKSQRVSLLVNLFVLTNKSVYKSLKLQCIKLLNFWDLFRIKKNGL